MQGNSLIGCVEIILSAFFWVPRAKTFILWWDSFWGRLRVTYFKKSGPKP